MFIVIFVSYFSSIQIFVVLVTLLTSSVVIIWYMFLLPVILTFNNTWFFPHVVIAHWLLINIVFHYYMGVFTSPGVPPQVKCFGFLTNLV